MKELLKEIRENLVKRGKSFVAFWCAFGRGFVAFWCAFGRFFKLLPGRTVTFFRNLPANTKKFFTTMTKDKAVDLLIGTGAVVVWSSPVFILLYVLFWFMSRSA